MVVLPNKSYEVFVKIETSQGRLTSLEGKSTAPIGIRQGFFNQYLQFSFPVCPDDTVVMSLPQVYA